MQLAAAYVREATDAQGQYSHTNKIGKVISDCDKHKKKLYGAGNCTAHQNIAKICYTD